jgi:RNA polymerase sigma-70 factor (ECF subfamily)
LPETPISLLERLRLRPDAASWQRLVDLYTPLIQQWLGRYSLQEADADDLTQEVLSALVRELPQFRHDLRQGAFRRWLRTVAVNRLHNFWRGRRVRPLATGDGDFQVMLNQLEDPESTLSRLWDEEHDRHIVRRLLQLIEPEFEPTTWRAFQALVLEGKKTYETAAQLGISVNAVRIAKAPRAEAIPSGDQRPDRLNTDYGLCTQGTVPSHLVQLDEMFRTLGFSKRYDRRVHASQPVSTHFF